MKLYSMGSVLYAGLIYVLSDMPRSGWDRTSGSWIFNLGHLFLYAGFAYFVFRGCREFSPQRDCRVLTGGIVAAYALFDEWHQSWVPGRTASVADLGLDVLGAALILLFFSGSRVQ